MKKFISAAMALALMLSISQTAFAAGTVINQDSENKSADTVVSFSVAPSYTVTIPEKVELNEQSDGTYKNDAEIICSPMWIPEGKMICVNIASDFTLTDTQTGKATLPYTVKTNAYDYNLADGDTAAEFITSNDEQTSTLHFYADEPKYAGTYSDTATFTLSLEKESVLVSTEEELNTALKSGTPAKLANDLTVDYIPTDADIDLNGKTLTTTQTYDSEVSKGKSFTIKNGAVKADSLGSHTILFSADKDSSITLNHMNVKTSGVAVVPFAENAVTNIKNSVITASVFALTIEANAKGFEGIAFNIENSTIETAEEDSCPVLYFAQGNVNINNSTIKGGRQGVILKGGSAKITNSTIISEATEETIAANDWDKYLDEDWLSGNEAPTAALVVGNRSTAYPYDVSCTVKNVTYESAVTDVYFSAAYGHSTKFTCNYSRFTHVQYSDDESYIYFTYNTTN